MNQVEFHIPPPADFLPKPVFCPKRGILSFFNKGDISSDKCIAACFCKSRPKLKILVFIRSKVVVKNAADPPAFLITVAVYKIIIAFLFENRIKTFIKAITNFFIYQVKMTGVFFE